MFVIYRDVSGEFRWRFKSANGEIIASSSEGYTDIQDCRKSLALMISAIIAPHIIEEL